MIDCDLAVLLMVVVSIISTYISTYNLLISYEVLCGGKLIQKASVCTKFLNVFWTVTSLEEDAASVCFCVFPLPSTS